MSFSPLNQAQSASNFYNSSTETARKTRQESKNRSLQRQSADINYITVDGIEEKKLHLQILQFHFRKIHGENHIHGGFNALDEDRKT